MKIRGKEIRFLKTVKATQDLAKLCPDGDLNRIEELLNSTASVIDMNAQVIHSLNEGYEMNKHFNDPSYEPKIISIEEILYLDQDVYTKLVEEAFNVLYENNQTVEIEESKKKEKKKKE